jgi:hypothetical protein
MSESSTPPGPMSTTSRDESAMSRLANRPAKPRPRPRPKPSQKAKATTKRKTGTGKKHSTTSKKKSIRRKKT